MTTLRLNSLLTFSAVLILNCSPALGESAVMVQKNEPAPYAGLLLDTAKAEETREAIIQRDALRERVASQEEHSGSEKLAFFVLGAAVSGLAFYVIHSSAH
jgi:hypothetical protein